MYAPATTAQHDPHHEPVRDVIARIEAELVAIAHAIDANHAHVAKASAEFGRDRPEFVRAMQEGDLLYQKVEDIAGFLRMLAAAMPVEWEIETGGATRGLKLDELARKIGADGQRVRPQPAADHGHVDLF